ncbi:MAG: hypothetical protein ACRCZQ_06840, partial [Bacteroidales bacterium]
PFQGFFQGITLPDPVDDHIHFTDLQHLDMSEFCHSGCVEARSNPGLGHPDREDEQATEL